MAEDHERGLPHGPSARDDPSACPRKALPVTLLTGFLGAGKTTRLNATLTFGKEKIAVIENEIGALGVDGELVANRHEDGIIELTNGCLCCSAEVDLVSALESLAHRRHDLPFDRVVIETTGLADVAPVVELIGDPADPLAADFFLDGVVTVVDAASFRRWASADCSVAGSAEAEELLASPVATWASGFGAPGGVALGATTGGLGRRAAMAAFWKQVALADQIILSKGDVAGEEAVEDARRALREANPLAQLLADGTGSGPLPPPRATAERSRRRWRHSPRGPAGEAGARRRR
ncbi:unnamed protein product [Prorocentrum cordatum]|uniref:CobW/HypB/UreG nucleotide-binding domain-containing protein n=1 Tax=Prorocentrum cordatum TaxID=2364126 RepID=A0ABN9PDF0_9DINO|nr:unnamed protein product [Polarella glacialis]